MDADDSADSGDASSGYVLSDEDYHFLVNTKCVHEIIPEVFKWCLESCINGNINIVIQNHIPKADLKKFWKKLSAKCKDGYETCDASTLYDLLNSEVCEHILNPYTRATPETTLEHSLRLAKNLRNNVCHNDYSKIRAEQTVKEIAKALNDIVERGGSRFGKDPKEIEEVKEKLKRQIQYIEGKENSNEDKIMAAAKNSLSSESAETWFKYVKLLIQNETLPFGRTEVSIKAVFHPVELQIINDESGHSEEKKKVILCTDILSKENNNTNFDIIEGDPGTGKSTILKLICLEFADNNIETRFKSLGNYLLMFHIICRDSEDINTFWSYLQKHYKETVKHFTEKQIIGALKCMKSLFLIDGLDECNESSTGLVKDVIQLFENCEQLKFVITTRPGFGSPFTKRFDQTGINYRVYNIRSITDFDKRIDFLERYQKQIPEMSKPGLIEMFKSKRTILFANYDTPLSLALFVYVFNTSANKIQDMNHDGSLLELVFKMCEENIENRMSESLGLNSSIYTEHVMETVSQFCLQWIQMHMVKVDQKNCDKLKEACWNKNRSIPIDKCMSCLFLKRVDPTSSDIVRYDFFHKQQQEYLASVGLVVQLGRTREGTLMDILSQLAGEQVDIADLKRYREVFRFSILQLSRPAQLTTLQHWRSQLTLAIASSDVNVRYCLNLMLHCLQSPEVGELLVDVICSYIKKKKPASLELNVLATATDPTPQLRLLLGRVKRLHRGDLDLSFEYSYDNYQPCDDVIGDLSGVKCRVSYFKGCLTTQAAVGALSAMGGTDIEVWVSVTDPLDHHLGELEEGLDCLGVKVPHRSCTAAPHHRPLPKANRIHLHVDGIPSCGASDAAALILALAPEDNEYTYLSLQHSLLSDAELDQLLLTLQEAGLRTLFDPEDKITSWDEYRFSNDRCCLCEQIHSSGGRCIKMGLSHPLPPESHPPPDSPPPPPESPTAS